MSFPRYPKYKASGVEWLGEVPEHWEVKRLRHVSKVRKGRLPEGTSTVQSAETDLPYLSMEFLRGEAESTAFVAESANLIRAEDKDTLLLWDGSNAGEFLRAKRGVVSSTVALIEPEGVTKDYLFFACKACERRLKDQTVGMGIPHVSGDELRSTAIPLPPLPEQTTIANFLDRETGKIDALVAEQRRLMELLKEKRQAVISHAVTKGLNPAAPMKDSGIDWLGQVPEHWEVKPLKHAITKIEQGWSPQCENTPAADDEWGVLKVGCGNGDRFDPTEQKALPPEVEAEPIYEIKPGDILMSRGNTLELVGAATFVADVRPKLLLCDLLYRFRARVETASSRFLVLLLRSPIIRFQIERAATGTSPSMKKIGQGVIRDLCIVLPPLAEQTAIVAHLERELAKFDTLTAEAQRAIDLLQERRTALISAAVTGQIDVRESVVTP